MLKQQKTFSNFSSRIVPKTFYLLIFFVSEAEASSNKNGNVGAFIDATSLKGQATGDRRSSVDPSASAILERSRVLIPSTTSTIGFFQFKYEKANMKRTKNEARIDPYFF